MVYAIWSSKRVERQVREAKNAGEVGAAHARWVKAKKCSFLIFSICTIFHFVSFLWMGLPWLWEAIAVCIVLGVLVPFHFVGRGNIVVQATPVPTMASVSAAGAVAPGVVIASTIGPAASSSTAPLLAEMCETFRVQLGLSHESSIKEVVEAAADMLGVRKDDKPLIELATRCWEELGAPPGEKI